ncbi:type II toxin-antitoxin system VapC family toxin [Acidithiobacillus sp. MC6.1]|nr:type II toxin-antitoxin system VapC family toxin [Acidithiobacillus sp. MC6.1]
MTGVKFLLDTNILIGLFNRNASVTALLTEKQAAIHQCAFSAITRMELLSYQGLTDTDRGIIEQLLARMHYLPITAAIEDTSIAFRQKHTCKLPDAIIAGTAALHQLELLTLDTSLARKAGAEAVSNI